MLGYLTNRNPNELILNCKGFNSAEKKGFTTFYPEWEFWVKENLNDYWHHHSFFYFITGYESGAFDCLSGGSNYVFPREGNLGKRKPE
jgi:hypothetical protein